MHDVISCPHSNQSEPIFFKMWLRENKIEGKPCRRKDLEKVVPALFICQNQGKKICSQNPLPLRQVLTHSNSYSFVSGLVAHNVWVLMPQQPFRQFYQLVYIFPTSSNNERTEAIWIGWLHSLPWKASTNRSAEVFEGIWR